MLVWCSEVVIYFVLEQVALDMMLKHLEMTGCWVHVWSMGANESPRKDCIYSIVFTYHTFAAATTLNIQGGTTSSCSLCVSSRTLSSCTRFWIPEHVSTRKWQLWIVVCYLQTHMCDFASGGLRSCPIDRFPMVYRLEQHLCSHVPVIGRFEASLCEASLAYSSSKNCLCRHFNARFDECLVWHRGEANIRHWLWCVSFVRVL